MTNRITRNPGNPSEVMQDLERSLRNFLFKKSGVQERQRSRRMQGSRMIVTGEKRMTDATTSMRK